MLKVDEYLKGNYISAKLTNNGSSTLGSIFRFELKAGESKTIEDMGVSKDKFDSVVANQLRYLIDDKKTLVLVGIKNKLVEKEVVEQPSLESIKGLAVSKVRIDEIQELPPVIEVVEVPSFEVEKEVAEPVVVVEDKKKKNKKAE